MAVEYGTPQSGTVAARRSATASARMVSRLCASMAIHVSAAASPRSRRAKFKITGRNIYWCELEEDEELSPYIPLWLLVIGAAFI